MSKNALQKYNDKRNFNVTAEPPDKLSPNNTIDLVFSVQKHSARKLHYDFRLEWNGVLWSWAVPKGPSYYSKDKRLAIRTEDHPLSYYDFEGTIPENQYGAGQVMLWDMGNWEPLDKNPAYAIQKGKLSFRLQGEKMHGEWTLLRMNIQDDKRENWLLIKNPDKDAIDKEDKDFLKNTDYSVKSGKK